MHIHTLLWHPPFISVRQIRPSLRQTNEIAVQISSNRFITENNKTTSASHSITNNIKINLQYNKGTNIFESLRCVNTFSNLRGHP